MKHYYDSKYDEVKSWISNQIDEGKGLNEIKGGLINDLSTFLKLKKYESNWQVNEEDWEYLTDFEWKEAEERQRILDKTRLGTMMGIGEDNDLKIPTSGKSSWVKYKKLLKSKGYSQESINAIEEDSFKILKKLSADIEVTGPIRGQVIGSVQSGKTANMAAVMSMASSYGWNMFIILSGMVENLRIQTETRLYEELSMTNGDVTWDLIEKPSLRNDSPKIPQRLNFLGHRRYMGIVLKNKKVLENLMDWLQSDNNKIGQMKILILDDESDQASVNTSDTSIDERKAINNLLVNLVNSKDKKGNKLNKNYGALNYIGYTATPYANILSEGKAESLYPRDFISMLSLSREYIGPQQIFGVPGIEGFEGMDIVRIIDNDPKSNDIETVKRIHSGKSVELPKSLKESIAYFISSSASLREHNFGKPVSMLIHTSHLQQHHDNLADSIQNWLNKSKIEVIELCEQVWQQEIVAFKKDDFDASFANYGGNIENTLNKQPFEKIKHLVEKILIEVSHIKVTDSNAYEYHSGVHICIDNSSYNRVTADDEHVRLYYPQTTEEKSKTPVFLVIGGTTLSRGLTLEGLISTYFLRNAGAADTLMQMGRWFGYRKGYELYPRVWMSRNAYHQFEYISQVDYSLRNEIIELNSMGVDYNNVAPKILNSPHKRKLKVTSNVKSRGAIAADYDFMGASIQTTIFDNDLEILRENIETTEKFLNELGTPKINFQYNKSVYWEKVRYKKVIKFLEDFIFNSRTRSFNSINEFNKWVQSMSEKNKLDDWNVIVVGKGEINNSENDWHLDNFSWNKINRTRIKNNIEIDDLIRIQTLRGPADLYRDIELDKIKDKELYSLILEGKTQNYRYIREKLHLEQTPQLFIYRIDKNSNASENSLTREDLNAKDDIIGIYISIPGGKRNKDYIAHLTVNVEPSLLSCNDMEAEEYDEN